MKQFPLFIIRRSGIVAMLVCLLAGACKKTPVFVDRQQIIYPINVQRFATNIQGYQRYWAPAQTVNGSFYPISQPWAFPIGLLRAEDVDLTVRCIIDTALIRLYDRLAHSANPSPALPSGAFGLVNSSVAINAGAIASADSIKMRIAPADGLDQSQSYIVPVRIVSVEPKPLQVNDTLRQTLFFQISFY